MFALDFNHSPLLFSPFAFSRVSPTDALFALIPPAPSCFEFEQALLASELEQRRQAQAAREQPRQRRAAIELAVLEEEQQKGRRQLEKAFEYRAQIAEEERQDTAIRQALFGDSTQHATEEEEDEEDIMDNDHENTQHVPCDELQDLFKSLFKLSSPSNAAASTEPRKSARSSPRKTKSTDTRASLAVSEDPASSSLERKFRRRVARRSALQTLDALSSSFDQAQSAFTSPTILSFQAQSTTSNSTSSPALAFVSANAPFLKYEDTLVTLLSKIDAIESGGDRKVRLERKALVKRVEAELAKLDSIKDRAWQLSQTEQSATSMPDKHNSATTDMPAQPSTMSPSFVTPRLDEDDDDSLPPILPLTDDALALLDNRTNRDRSSSPCPSDSDASTASSTLTVSSTGSRIDEYISEMLKRANKAR
ncbi:BAG family molecular chaperone regulator [Sporobolomyces koalae]|uniref:BAG family molecular chaperone regulator n=1 Tax=Sporobolomyces koalae TaxID=500713 RepID=UPI003182A31F